MAGRDMTPERYAVLLQEVAVVAAPWAEGSADYEGAETYTETFWDERQPFRQFFNRLDRRVLVELAAGHGRHAVEAAELSPCLYVLDVLPENVAFCRNRLAEAPHVTCVQIDGVSFQPLEDSSVTGIYCYDAMVHFSPGIVEAYLHDAARVLAPGGCALFHHSNYPAPFDRHYGQNPHARNHMTLPLFTLLTQAAGLELVESRVMSWGGQATLDRLSLVRKPA
jgi:SAM-dependent methyltransferase